MFLYVSLYVVYSSTGINNNYIRIAVFWLTVLFAVTGNLQSSEESQDCFIKT